MIVHGGKFQKKLVAKCGRYKSAIINDGDRIVSYMAGMAEVTCRACIAKHKPGVC